MSTKVTIKYRDDFHLYSDVTDGFSVPAHEQPVHLILRNCLFECRQDELGLAVTVQIPRAVARALGLVPREKPLTPPQLKRSNAMTEPALRSKPTRHILI